VAAERILVVDDSMLHLKLVRVLLIPEGYEVITALDAEEGLLALREMVPSLVLVDIDMPGMDGITLVRHVRDDVRLRTVPIVVVSARQGLYGSARALAAGASLYMTKPIDTKTFPDVVASLVRGGAHQPAPSRTSVPPRWEIESTSG
jgi:two-component system cell cycle response regulator